VKKGTQREEDAKKKHMATPNQIIWLKGGGKNKKRQRKMKGCEWDRRIFINVASRFQRRRKKGVWTAGLWSTKRRRVQGEKGKEKRKKRRSHFEVSAQKLTTQTEHQGKGDGERQQTGGGMGGK